MRQRKDMVTRFINTPIYAANTERNNGILRDVRHMEIVSKYDMSYGMNNGNLRFLFITGRTEPEKELPLFTLPIFDVSDNKITVVVNLRHIMKPVPDFDKPLIENVSNIAAFKAMILPGVLESMLSLDGDMYSLQDKAATIYSGIITKKLIEAIGGTPSDDSRLGVIVYDILNYSYDRSQSFDVRVFKASKNTMYGRLPEDMVRGYLNDKLEINTISDIVEELKRTQIGVIHKLDVASFIGLISRISFGIENIEFLKNGLFSVTSFISAVYSNLTDRQYRKTELKVYLDIYSKIFKVKELEQTLDNEVNRFLSRVTMEDDTGIKFREIATTINHRLFVSDLDNKRLYKLYLGDIADDDADMPCLFEALKEAGSKDEITIIIDSGGGYINQGLKLIHILLEKFKGRITVELNCVARSMGTLFYSIGDKRVVYPFSELMFHNYSSGSIGKGNEIVSQVSHNDDRFNAMNQYFVVDSGLLTQEEFEQLKIGADFWFGINEIVDRDMCTHVQNFDKLMTVEEYKKQMSK